MLPLNINFYLAMANFNEHLNQAQSNLSFLREINSLSNHYWDWQVTTCFYVAVHLINAYIADKSNMHYRSHEDVAQAINPYNQLSPLKVTDEVYVSYCKLQNLSRRARYLINDNMKNRETNGHFTSDKHFIKALKSLDRILDFFIKKYPSESFDTLDLHCMEGKKTSFAYFQIL